ncbi:MAG: methylmalonate-semialdehyde dehydrogenase (acylating) [Lentisphaerae bacterium GWF2_49_21]|nr:MAG: methylmalonate-semialdehyde dehydrogenase (acylating) [Lentisphaerae bacterium GWF2_49_21]
MTVSLKNLIGDSWRSPNGTESQKIIDPSDGKTVVADLVASSPDDVVEAVTAACAAFPDWRSTPVVQRCRILFHIKELLEEKSDELSEILVKENGKTLIEAQGDVRRGIEVVEFAAGMPSLSKGDFIEDIASNVDGFIYREPLGVVVGACPFNFPAMIPLWMMPVAIACGNTFILKPSDKCPVTATKIAEIFVEGGLPAGVLNVLQGGRETFETLIATPEVKAISFVGSTPVARKVWENATANHKRVQALGGAKNYIVVMPDADEDAALNAVIGSSFGCAGERCMASSVLVLVGGAENLLPKIIEAAQKLKVGNGLEPDTQMGPVISKEAKKRIEDYIQVGVDEGAELVLDGRNITVPDKENGYFLAPSIFSGVKPEMQIAREEIFGPVLSVMKVANLATAIELANASEFGNGASIFTNSGGAAREFRNKIQCGMIGINTGVPAPMAFFSFGGHKNSIFGDLKAQGPDAVEFYTQKKSVIERWPGKLATGSIWGK